jgi:hypothetical protein
MNLRPHDVVVVLKLAIGHGASQAEIAVALGISAAEVSNVLVRAAHAHLFSPGTLKDKRRGQLGAVRIAGLCEFAIHGVRYAFPAKLGEIVVGMPTAWGAPPLAKVIVASRDGVPVWPDADGNARGMAVEPLYPAAPQAARIDSRLYELMALIDAMRIGGARERGQAADLFSKTWATK